MIRLPGLVLYKEGKRDAVFSGEPTFEKLHLFLKGTPPPPPPPPVPLLSLPLLPAPQRWGPLEVASINIAIVRMTPQTCVLFLGS